jgi:hypothetical protein
MQRIISALALSMATTLCFAGCGGDDDDDSTNNKAGSGNKAGTSSASAGEPGTSNEGGTTGNGTPEPGNGNVPCDPSQATTCQNDMDCPFVVDGRARGAAQTCGKGECLSADADENCARDCILAELEMSGDCASCYADFVKAACVADPDSEGCHTCQATKGCRPTFDECSGLGE